MPGPARRWAGRPPPKPSTSSYCCSNKAVLRRPLEPKQYTSGDYAALADDLAVWLSTGRTGQCWDNALAESFFASLKGECLDLQPWPTRAGARRATVDSIAWYNGTRLHSALGYLTPNEYESITRKEVTAQAA